MACFPCKIGYLHRPFVDPHPLLFLVMLLTWLAQVAAITVTSIACVEMFDHKSAHRSMSIGLLTAAITLQCLGTVYIPWRGVDMGRDNKQRIWGIIDTLFLGGKFTVATMMASDYISNGSCPNFHTKDVQTRIRRARNGECDVWIGSFISEFIVLAMMMVALLWYHIPRWSDYRRSVNNDKVKTRDEERRRNQYLAGDAERCEAE